jgi:predicted membrane channel-forming protein YqfA (hemolysin III family)
MIVSILFALLATVLAGVSLRAVFRSLDPADVRQYRACAGGWWEEELNQCRAGLLRVPQQPVNTYTNLAYFAGGWFLALHIGTVPAFVFGVMSLYLCVGSALYHGTSTRWAGSLDVSSMYAVFSALAVHAASIVLGFRDRPAVALVMFVVATAAAYFLRYKYKGNMQLKIGLFLGLTYALVLIGMASRSDWGPLPWFIASLALFALAFLFWNLDKRRRFPIERWGHGVWHLMTAGAITILFYCSWLLG